MKSLLKKLLPALALTLMIAGTITASAVGTSKKSLDEQWYGVRQSGQEVLITNPETSFNPENDCNHLQPVCVQIYNDGDPGDTIDGGPYNK